MSDVTQILSAIEAGDALAAEQLFPLVYRELRQLAKSRMANEKSDHTLQATALVHEAFVRLVDVEQARQWQSRRHFFASAAEAMRRILIDHAKHRGRFKRGGDLRRQTMEQLEVPQEDYQIQLVAIDDVLDQLASEDGLAADVMKLRYFVGMSTEEAGEALGISRAAAYRKWVLARAWLQCELDDEHEET